MTELEIKDEMEWLSDLQKLMADIDLQVGKMEQYKHESKGLCLEQMKMPQFNGDIRNYPRFKSDFQYNQRWEVSSICIKVLFVKYGL